MLRQLHNGDIYAYIYCKNNEIKQVTLRKVQFMIQVKICDAHLKQNKRNVIILNENIGSGISIVSSLLLSKA